ncbi:ATP-binding protein [Nanoarchaeota archaeon]
MSFETDFENKVKTTIKRFNLFSKKDKVLVAASGGKDSTTLLYLLKKFGYNVEAITINAFIGNYSKKSLEDLREFCKQNKVKLHEFSLRKEFGYSLCYIRSILKSKGTSLNSCAICGALRRYLLNKYVRKIKADVIATGHNLNDESYSILMNLFRNTMKLNARIGPRTESKKGFVPRVKPLYLCFEKEVERYSKLKKFPVHYGWCPCSTLAFRRFFAESGVNDKELLNMVENFISLQPKMREFYKGGETSKCNNCKEPSTGELCQACNIIKKLK